MVFRFKAQISKFLFYVITTNETINETKLAKLKYQEKTNANVQNLSIYCCLMLPILSTGFIIENKTEFHLNEKI